MGVETDIEWADATVNQWEGCTQISPACRICYAKARAERYGTVEWNGPPRKVKSGVTNMRLINQRAKAAGRVSLVFINSLSDVFDKNAPPAWRTELFDEVKRAPWVMALFLTKRIGNAEEMSAAAGGFPQNAALASTICDQEEAERDLPKLARAAIALRARWTFASIEPLLGPVDLELIDAARSLDAIIVGGESGGDAMPMHPDWARQLRDWSARHSVSFMFKQWGAWAPSRSDNPDLIMWRDRPDDKRPRWSAMDRVGKNNAGRRLDGRTHDDFLRVDRSRAAA